MKAEKSENYKNKSNGLLRELGENELELVYGGFGRNDSGVTTNVPYYVDPVKRKPKVKK